MDNIPGPLFNATSIDPTTDAYFLQEGEGFLSQYFFAIAPKHPLMFLAVHDVMREIHQLMDTVKFYVPVVTGPGVTKRAFLHFMGINISNGNEIGGKYSRPNAGHYIGTFGNNRSVTVVGSGRTCQEYVVRGAIRGIQKTEGWQQMNITEYQGGPKQPNGKTCFRAIQEYYMSQGLLE